MSRSLHQSTQPNEVMSNKKHDLGGVRSHHSIPRVVMYTPLSYMFLAVDQPAPRPIYRMFRCRYLTFWCKDLLMSDLLDVRSDLKDVRTYSWMASFWRKMVPFMSRSLHIWGRSLHQKGRSLHQKGRYLHQTSKSWVGPYIKSLSQDRLS